jgi:hypothetical protein
MYSDIVLSDIVNQLKFGYSIFRDRYKAVHGNSAGEKKFHHPLEELVGRQPACNLS